jgi:hypothetical protein
MPRGQRIDAFNKRGPDNVGSYAIATQQRADDINAYIDFVKRGKPLPKALKATLVSAGILTAAQAEAGVLPSVKKLVEAGYPESTAQKIVSGELPMDFESRMIRAEDQGFDIDTRYFHGTDKDILAFDPALIGKGKGRTPAALPQGFYFSRNPKVASEYAVDDGANVIPVYLKTEDLMTRGDLQAFKDFNAGQGDSLLSRSGDVMIVRNPDQIRSTSAAFDPDEIGNPNIMASPAPVGAVGGLLASEAVTPEGQLNPLLAVPAEIGSALNEAIVGTADFLVPDTVNAISELLGTEYRMPRLSDQELVRLYTQGGYMDEGYGRDAIRTATGLLSPL